MMLALRWLTASATLAGALSLRADTPLDDARSALAKWVETRQLISKTRSDWQSDRQLLDQTRQLLERELRSIEDQVATLSTNNAQVEKERKQAEAALRSSRETLDRAKQFAADFEGKILRLVPRLPGPLQETLKPLLARVPADAANTSAPATERVQVIVGILNELDKFNNAVTVFSERRRNEKGEEVAVETLYVGLGAAYFVNQSGDFAGVGAPGSTGWEWSTNPALAATVRNAIRIYRNEQPARFLALPVTVK